MITRFFSTLSAFYFLFLCGCQDNANPETPPSDPSAIQTAMGAVDSTSLQWQQLLALYPLQQLPLSISTRELETGDSSTVTLPMYGRLIPPHLLPLFGDYVQARGEEVFAVGKILLPNGQIALLTRVPSHYSSSRIQLFVLNSTSNRIKQELELAESISDAGDSYTRTCVLRPASNGGILLSMKQQNCWPLGEELKELQCADSLFGYRLQDRLVRLYRRRASTL